MAVETAVFVSGVGLLVTLDLAVLGISVVNARKVGHDATARQAAAEAEEQAQYAARRVTDHEAEFHGGRVEAVGHGAGE